MFSLSVVAPVLGTVAKGRFSSVRVVYGFFNTFFL